MSSLEKRQKYEAIKEKSLLDPKLKHPLNRERFLNLVRKKLGLVDDEFTLEREKLRINKEHECKIER